ncbi:uncharacterized protein BX664DRAFT_337636 [Halteromyces radiatus]|uniref:uncharacterized protein n=1 Tax=Halteromyces radiatus TaxID=101107 RepID=UPI00222098F5|nr:uncharacterized protein BX664DRAFT_337636 [Halteromyces radiatus]KAI8084728.1 hypothetical protein BX664DRAFT_337636 [Halteromyces radiatus]
MDGIMMIDMNSPPPLCYTLSFYYYIIIIITIITFFFFGHFRSVSHTRSHIHTYIYRLYSPFFFFLGILLFLEAFV